MASKKVVLITGCSRGTLGDALALAFHAKGLRVIATARSVEKMAHLQTKGIETLPLDVQSLESIAACAQRVNAMCNGHLDILVNNAGRGYSMPVADADLNEVRDLFELNVFSYVTMIQTFLPMVLKARGLIVNQTSIVSVISVPMTAFYNASKAAIASVSDTLRIELEPFGVRVVDLKTGVIGTGFFVNINNGQTPRLPPDSIYQPAREAIEKSMSGAAAEKDKVPADQWAQQVVKELLKDKPAIRIWKGGLARTTWFIRRFLPHAIMDNGQKKYGGLDVLQQRLSSQGIMRSEKA